MSCPTCKKPPVCQQFGDFTIVNPTDKLYTNAVQFLVVNCPDGTTPVVTVPAGVIGFVLTFAIGNAPYPPLSLNCTGGQISVQVPDDATQSQLDGLINGMLNQCAEQVAQQQGCAAGDFLNAPLSWFPGCPTILETIGPFPNGVTVDPTNTIILVAEGVITSTISQADADGKALQLAQEVFNSGQVVCVLPS